jgi:AraC family transcriptional regulator, regulatory protein of adaptative response / methylated-DNA-[protein]-cysteine methyltransferase
MTKCLNASFPIRYSVQSCWLGEMLIAVSKKGICSVLLGDDANALRDDLRRRFSGIDLVEDAESLQQTFDTINEFLSAPTKILKTPLDLKGTAFQQLVWAALCEIPVATTTSYTKIAVQIGRPQSVRAVAQAIGANPVAIVVPCHRVVRSDGSLCGYRWGVERKRQLQLWEQQLPIGNPAHSSTGSSCSASTRTWPSVPALEMTTV